MGDGREVQGGDTCRIMADSLCCTVETNNILLIKNKIFFKNGYEILIFNLNSVNQIC